MFASDALRPASASDDPSIREVARPKCPSCGARGAVRYENLRDNFYGAPGEWNFARCPRAGCAMLWLDPVPAEDDLWKAYRNYFTHDTGVDRERAPGRGFARAFRDSIKTAYQARWCGESARDLTWRERILALLAYFEPIRRADTDFPLRYLARQKDGRLLDVGCGRGDTLHRLSSFGWHAEGIDTDPEAVEVARRTGTRVRLGSLLEQKYPDQAFDAVVMS